MIVAGVDPGLSGAIAFLDTRDNSIEFHDMPVVDNNVDAASLAALFRDNMPAQAMIEQVASRPGQGVSSVFKFGMGYGAALGVMAGLGIPTMKVTSGRWKKFYSLSSDKEKSRALALAMWPQSARELRRKKDEGRAEAGLIAAYLAQQIKANRL